MASGYQIAAWAAGPWAPGNERHLIPHSWGAGGTGAGPDGMAHGSSEWNLAKQTKDFQSLRRQAGFQEKGLRAGWVRWRRRGAGGCWPAAFNFRVLRTTFPAPELSLRSPEADVLAPTAHSFTLLRSPVHARAAEATPPEAGSEAGSERRRLCTGAHFGLSNYLSTAASPLTDVCISTAAFGRPTSQCPHSARTPAILPNVAAWQARAQS